MRAAFCVGSGRFEVRDVPRPEPKDDEALIRIRACGICGSDKRALAGEKASANIPGHELSGVVDQVAAGLGVAEGQEVVADPILFCGECKYCAAERTFFCTQRGGVIGYGAGGGFAEYVAAPVRCLHPKPGNIGFAEASLVEPLAVAVGAVRLRDVAAHDCIVFGAGAIGTMLAQVLKARAADQVYVVDIDESHLEIARQLGDFVTINAENASAWDAIGAMAPKMAYDVVGSSHVVTAKALDLLPANGTLVLIGPPPEGALDIEPIEKKTLSVIRTQGVSIAEMREAVRLLAGGDVSVGPLVTGRFPLERIEDAFQASLTGIKVVVEP